MVLRTSGGTVALLTDRQGTVVAAIKPDGTWDQSFPSASGDLFGAKPRPATVGATSTNTGFSGAASTSSGSGPVYLRNRWYDPQTGRFLTQDPIGLAGGVNLYAYAGNNPSSFSDPFGLMEDTIKAVGPNKAQAQQIIDDCRSDAVCGGVAEYWDSKPGVTIEVSVSPTLDDGRRILGGHHDATIDPRTSSVDAGKVTLWPGDFSRVGRPMDPVKGILHELSEMQASDLFYQRNHSPPPGHYSHGIAMQYEGVLDAVRRFSAGLMGL